jgi:hypothetical protein
MLIHAGAVDLAVVVSPEPKDIVDMVHAPFWSMHEDNGVLHGGCSFDGPKQAAGEAGDLHGLKRSGHSRRIW